MIGEMHDEPKDLPRAHQIEPLGEPPQPDPVDAEIVQRILDDLSEPGAFDAAEGRIRRLHLNCRHYSISRWRPEGGSTRRTTTRC